MTLSCFENLHLVRSGTLHGMWIWRVHLAHISKIGGVATLNGMLRPDLDFPWQLPMLGKFKCASAFETIACR